MLMLQEGALCEELSLLFGSCSFPHQSWELLIWSSFIDGLSASVRWCLNLRFQLPPHCSVAYHWQDEMRIYDPLVSKLQPSDEGSWIQTVHNNLRLIEVKFHFYVPA